MKTLWLFAGIAFAALALGTVPTSAATHVATDAATDAATEEENFWENPQNKQCSLQPNQDCGMEAKCPADAPFIQSGGGGLSKVSDKAHHLAMTMNGSISEDTWRVSWRNMGDKKVDVTVMIRILCEDDDDDDDDDDEDK